MSPDWLVTMTFLVEGVFLMIVACMGLVGNILSFTVLITQKVQKTFHNLLMLLNTFDTVGKTKLLISLDPLTLSTNHPIITDFPLILPSLYSPYPLPILPPDI